MKREGSAIYKIFFKIWRSWLSWNEWMKLWYIKFILFSSLCNYAFSTLGQCSICLCRTNFSDWENLKELDIRVGYERRMVGGKNKMWNIITGRNGDKERYWKVWCQEIVSEKWIGMKNGKKCNILRPLTTAEIYNLLLGHDKFLSSEVKITFHREIK